MITNYDIDKKLYRLLKAEFEAPAVPMVGHTYIGGHVYNGDRALNSNAEDITVKTLSMGNEGYPQYATVNVNVYVPDIAEKHGGYVRNGSRLSSLASAVTSAIQSFDLPNGDIEIGSVTEIQLEAVHQHFVNIRLNVVVCGSVS